MSLYSVLPSFVLGFHGCDRTTATRVVTRRTALQASTNEYDWLGSGIYFWENSYERALEWAVENKDAGRIKNPAVIGAVIDLGICLNLLDRQYLKTVQEAYASLVETVQGAGKQLPKNKRLRGSRDLLLRNLDCATVNMVHALRENANLAPYDIVRAVFTEGKPLYTNSGFREKNHIQICVRNVRSIKGYFHPLDEPLLQ